MERRGYHSWSRLLLDLGDVMTRRRAVYERKQRNKDRRWWESLGRTVRKNGRGWIVFVRYGKRYGWTKTLRANAEVWLCA
jgi:hypothetical protein